MRACPFALCVFIGLVASGGCRSRSDSAAVQATQKEIADTMERYMVAARAVDADRVAAFFTPTGTLFEPGISPIQSRQSIRAFMASFPGVRVEVATATPDEIEVFGNTAFLWGSYFERLAFPGQPVSEQHGKFVIEWMRQADRSWLIHRFFRVPVSSPSPAPAAKSP